MSRYVKVEYNTSDEIMDMKLLASDNQKIHTFKFNAHNKKSVKEVANILWFKYNIDFSPDKDECKGDVEDFFVSQ